MNTLYAEYIKTIVNGVGTLGAAAIRRLPQGQPIKWNMERKVIDHILSNNPNPNARFLLPANFMAQFSFSDAEYTDLPMIMGGGTATGDVFTLTQALATASKYDLRIAARNASNVIMFLDFTAMFFTPKIEAQFVDNGELFIPAELTSSDTSQFTWDISPA